MQRLGEILVAKGSLTLAELHTGLEACRRHGGRLGSRLIRFGFVEERALLEALAQQFGVPYASEAMLRRWRPSLTPRLPLAMLRELEVVPFNKAKNRLQVGMSNPKNSSAIDKVARFTRLQVEPYVASDLSIKKVLGRDMTLRDHEAPAADEPEEEVCHLVPITEGWDDLWEPTLDPWALLRVGPKLDPDVDPLMATFPGLLPLPATPAPSTDNGKGTKPYEIVFREAATTSEVADRLLRHAARILDRACLFSVHKGTIEGWAARGIAHDAADIRSFSVFADAPSVFSTLRPLEAYLGPIQPGAVNDQLLKVLGEPRPLEVVIVPVPVRTTVKGFLVGDLLHFRVPKETVDELIDAARVAGEALLRVVTGR